MVRRWSYLASVNSFYDKSYEGHQQAAFGVTVRATMYFKGTYTVPSKLTRGRWARRRHVYGWLHLSNILKSWSQIYRFNRTHLKGSLRQHVTPLNFLAFNAVTVQNSIPSRHVGSNNIAVSTLPKRVVRYFSKYNVARSLFLLKLKNFNISYVSIPNNTQDVSIYTDNKFAPVLVSDNVSYLSQPHISPNARSSSLLALNDRLSRLVFQHTLPIVVSMYRVLTLLTLISIKVKA